MRDVPRYLAGRPAAVARCVMLAAVLGIPGSAAVARADSCGEVRESCLETCRIDHGMDKERRRLADCISRCDDQREDCLDVRREERRNLRPPDALPQDKPAPPPDVRPADEDSSTATVVHEQSADDSAPRERRRAPAETRASASREEPVPTDGAPPPTAEKPEPRPSDAPAPPADAPLPEGPAHDDFDRGGDE